MAHRPALLQCLLRKGCVQDDEGCGRFACANLAQILRSIDSDSADGFPTHQAEAMKMGLDSGKGKIIEYSIQKVGSSTVAETFR